MRKCGRLPVEIHQEKGVTPPMIQRLSFNESGPQIVKTKDHVVCRQNPK
jgi:hypothetical protein